MVCFFYLSSKRNRKFKHLVQTKPMGKNTITNIMKVSVAGTSLKESEKKVYESYCKKNNCQQAEESKDCKFRIYRQCHRQQRFKFPQRLRWSRRRRAAIILSCNRLRRSTIGLAGCGIWLFFCGDTGDASSRQEREAGILIASGSGISYFYELGMRET